MANGPGDLGSIPGRVMPKTFKMVLDTSLLNTQQYKVRIKDKVEQSRKRGSALINTSVLKLLKREPSGRPRLRSATLLTIIIITNPLQVFLTSVSWWFSTGVWETASLLKSPELFSVFWPIIIMLYLGWSPLVYLFPSLSIRFTIFWGF